MNNIQLCRKMTIKKAYRFFSYSYLTILCLIFLIVLPAAGYGAISNCDFDHDGDVDGVDFAAYITDPMGISLADFAAVFGSVEPSVLLSDDFNHNNLNTALWTFVNPLSDATVRIVGAGSGNAQLLLSVPAGPSHDPGDVNEAARLMQPAADTDFQIEVKFDSPVQQRYQDQGIIVEESANNWLRFDNYSNGSSTYIYAASIVNGSSSEKIRKVIATAAPIYLNVQRTGNTWGFYYSYDGLAWTSAGSFAHALAVTAVGPYAGNFDTGNNAPAHTAVIDYFFNMADPVEPEDGGDFTDELPPFLQQIDYGGATASIQATWWTDEPSSSYIEYGVTPSLELGTYGQDDNVWSHSVTVDNLLPDTPYYFRVVSEDPSGNQSVSQIEEVLTGFSEGPTIEVWYGLDQSFGYPGIPQQWVNILGNVRDPDGVSSLTYSLNGGGTIPLSIGPDTRRLSAEGDFNIEIDFSDPDLVDGINIVELTAVDDNGNEATETVTVDYVAGNQWPENYSINWNTVTEIQQVAQVVDGLWSINAGGVGPVQLGYDRLIAIGDIGWHDYEVTVPITVNALDPSGYLSPSNGPAVGIGLRWTGHTAWENWQPRYGFWPTGAFAWYRWKDSYERFQLEGNWYPQIPDRLVEDTSGRTLSFGVPYIFKVRVETLLNGNPYYSFKVWQQGEQEPVGWDLTMEEDQTDPLSETDPLSGSVLLLAHHVAASFGDVQIVSLTSPASSLQATPQSSLAERTFGNETGANKGSRSKRTGKIMRKLPRSAMER